MKERVVVLNKTGVLAQNPPNNTTINSTNNITINVGKNNDDLMSGLKILKNHKRGMSLTTPTAIGEIGNLVNFKNEGFAQEIAETLNDHKSLPFFRALIVKFVNHEDIIYKCLSLTRETQELSGIKTSRGAVFTDHIKREAEHLGIKI